MKTSMSETLAAIEGRLDRLEGKTQEASQARWGAVRRYAARQAAELIRELVGELAAEERALAERAAGALESYYLSGDLTAWTTGLAEARALLARLRYAKAGLTSARLSVLAREVRVAGGPEQALAVMRRRVPGLADLDPDAHGRLGEAMNRLQAALDRVAEAPEDEAPRAGESAEWAWLDLVADVHREFGRTLGAGALAVEARAVARGACGDEQDGAGAVSLPHVAALQGLLLCMGGAAASEAMHETAVVLAGRRDNDAAWLHERAYAAKRLCELLGR